MVVKSELVHKIQSVSEAADTIVLLSAAIVW